MKYKTDENGKIEVGENGHPILIGDDGAESVIDAIGLYNENGKLRSEAKDYRQKASQRGKELEDWQSRFEGIDPKEARSALETIANLDKEQKEIAKAATAPLEKQLKELMQEKETLASRLFSVQHESQFATSPVIKKTIYADTPDDAFRRYKQHCHPDGHYVDHEGNTIYSRENAGQKASFDEAMSIIIASDPKKDAILRSTASGGGDGHKGKDGESRVGTIQTRGARDNIRAGLERLRK